MTLADLTKPIEGEAPKVLTPTSLGGLQVQKVEAKAKTLNYLIYGDSGIGKTTLCGSAQSVAEMSPVLIIDIEAGVEPLRTFYPDVAYIPVRTVKEVQKVYDDLHKGGHGYNTIVIDSLTELQKMYMDEIMVNVVRENSDRDPDVPGMWEYGKNTEQVRKLVKAFKQLPVNTIFTALAQEREVNNLTKTVPDFTKKLIGDIPAQVDEVFYLYTKTIKNVPTRLLLTQRTDKIAAKDRSATLPPVIEEPTFEMIYRTMYPA